MRFLRLFALTAVFAACSDNGPGVNPNPQCALPFPAFDPANPIVRIRTFEFQPDSAPVSVGATVKWINCEDPTEEPHTTTSNTGVWDSDELAAGEEFTHTFSSTGTFLYHCTPHPFMPTAKIVVQ